jgi:hypothetical protein
MTEILQRTLDAGVAQLGFSDAIRTTSRRISRSTLGRPGRRGRFVHFLAMSDGTTAASPRQLLGDVFGQYRYRF